MPLHSLYSHNIVIINLGKGKRMQQRKNLTVLVLSLLLVFCSGQAVLASQIIAWGGNDYGQTDCPDGNDYVAIDGGFAQSLALKADGSLVGWGRDDSGQATVPAGNDFAAISAGGSSLALE